MEDILGHMYCWFDSFFGQNLSFFLWGYDPALEGYPNPNLFNTVGLVTLLVTFTLVCVFYFVINSSRLCTWWSWLLNMTANSVIALFLGYSMVFSRRNEIPESLMYSFNEQGDVVSSLINDSNFWGFGIANMFIAMIFFIALSFILKWKSSAAKYIPF